VPRLSLIPVAVLVAAIAVIGLALAGWFGGGSGALIVVVGFVGALLGFVVSRRLSSQRELAATQITGALICLIALVLRAAPWLNGSENTVMILGRPLVVGEISGVLAVIGIGAMLSSLADDSERLRTGGASKRVQVRVLSVLVALAPVVPFALSSSRDLGPLVVLLAAVVVMCGRSLDRIGFVVIAGLVLAWLGALAVSTIRIVQQRFADLADGGYQLDLARLTISQGGVFWGGGLGRNGFGEALPVAESDHLPAYLAGSIGLLPFLALVAVLFWCLTRLGRRLPLRADAAVVASTGLLAAAALQTGWTVLGSFAVVPLTGIPFPVLSASGSSWFAWGVASGFVVATVLRGRARGPARAQVPADAVPSARHISRGIAVVGVSTVVLAALSGGMLIVTPPPDGTTGAYSTLLDRGALISSDGVVLAFTDAEGRRVWTQGADTVELLGVLVPSVNQSGTEAAASGVTTCGGGGWSAQLLRGVAGPRCTPADVVTTIDLGLQQEVVAAASVNPGSSIIVLDGTTLDVLAGYSAPITGARTDPNGLSAGEIDLEVAPGDPESPFYPAVLAEPIPPGSIFKLPVLAVAAEHGLVDGSSLPVSAFSSAATGVHNSFGTACPGDDVVTAIALSCNTVTAAYAQSIGQEALAEGLRTLYGLDGGERTLDGGSTEAGSTGLTEPLQADQLARTAIGLESVRVTMLELALLVAHSAGTDDGAAPSIVSGVCAPGAASPDPLERTGRTVGRELDDDVVALVREGMGAAVTDGTAAAVLSQVEGPLKVEVLAKTGTPDRIVDGRSVNDSLIAVVVGDLVMVVRVPGSSENPTPDLDTPAVEVAAGLLPSLGAYATTIEQPTVCPEATP
jgi:cell division protein FtsW (lipid II flippase)